MLDTLRSAPESEISLMHREGRKKQSRIRLRFWEVEDFFKCPLIGGALTQSEQKQILKKTDFQVKKASPFELHETLVACSKSENRMSKRIDALLERKFGKEAELLSRLDPRKFMMQCKVAFESGSYLAVLWAASVRPDLSFELRREVFGEIHMAMHHNANHTFKIERKMAGQRDALSELRQNIKDAGRRERSLRKENKHRKRENAELAATLAAVEKEKAELAGELVGLKDRRRQADLERENRILREKLEDGKLQAASFKKEIRRLTSELERQRELNRQVIRETEGIKCEIDHLNRCDEGCPSFDLCQKRVLIVGGITRMESLYRDLIESNGGLFEYHDGYMKKGDKRLESRLKRADVVLCPVSCNSHAACSMVKNLAKKHKKTVHLLTNCSLNTVSRVFRDDDSGVAATLN